MMMQEELWKALQDEFPQMDFCMAYGSGVFSQLDHDNSSSMIDLVFAVDDPVQWHTDNLERNWHHYSFLRQLGASSIASFQEKYGAGVYYNTLIHLKSPVIGERMIKYGVVSSRTLCNDLNDWNTLYLSGRMHKPVSILNSTSKDIQSAASRNLKHALHYALLCLPEKFTERELFMRIAGISYLGDFRMTFGENPRKVRNIVDGNMRDFKRLYQKKIAFSEFVSPSLIDGETMVSNVTTPKVREEVMHELPLNVRRRLAGNLAQKAGKDVKKGVQYAVSSIVHRYSRSQSIKGIFTAGAVKSAMYVAQKLQRTYWRKVTTR